MPGKSIDPAKSIHVDSSDHSGLDQLRRECRVDPQAVRRFCTSLFKHGLDDGQSLAALPREMADRVRLHSLELHRCCDSQQDGASKLLFRTEQGMLIEAVVLRIATGRTTLCVSSQVGCAAACEFCATGKMGIARNLSAAEIVDQIVQANQLLRIEDRRVRNLVFMGMGEPFHNEENLYQALEMLLDPRQFHHPASRILVSTVGLSEAMIRCARRFPGVNLALSLHSVRQEVRARLIPLAVQNPLSDLRRAIGELNRIQRTRGKSSTATVMIEYLMLAGVNDSVDDAAELADWLDGLAVHVNLIPYNAIDGAPHLSASPREVRDRFANLLKRKGIPTTIRYSLGADVAAACGQLVQQENRRTARR